MGMFHSYVAVYQAGYIQISLSEVGSGSPGRRWSLALIQPTGLADRVVAGEPGGVLQAMWSSAHFGKKIGII